LGKKIRNRVALAKEAFINWRQLMATTPSRNVKKWSEKSWAWGAA
jgi:hypothetical protein